MRDKGDASQSSPAQLPEVMPKSPGVPPKKFQMPNTPLPPIPGLIDELQQVQKKAAPRRYHPPGLKIGSY